MLEAGKGLSHIATKDLKAMLRALHRGELETPISPKALTVAGLVHLQDELGFLVGKGEDTVRAVLVAVLAERR